MDRRSLFRRAGAALAVALAPRPLTSSPSSDPAPLPHTPAPIVRKSAVYLPVSDELVADYATFCREWDEQYRGAAAARRIILSE